MVYVSRWTLLLQFLFPREVKTELTDIFHTPIDCQSFKDCMGSEVEMHFIQFNNVKDYSKQPPPLSSLWS